MSSEIINFKAKTENYKKTQFSTLNTKTCFQITSKNHKVTLSLDIIMNREKLRPCPWWSGFHSYVLLYLQAKSYQHLQYQHNNFYQFMKTGGSLTARYPDMVSVDFQLTAE